MRIYLLHTNYLLFLDMDENKIICVTLNLLFPTKWYISKGMELCHSLLLPFFLLIVPKVLKVAIGQCKLLFAQIAGLGIRGLHVYLSVGFGLSMSSVDMFFFPQEVILLNYSL